MSNGVVAAAPAALSVQYVREVIPEEVAWLLLMCGGNAALFTDMKGLLTPADLNKPEEFALRLTWAAMLKSVERYHGMSYESLCACATEYLNAKPEEAALYTDAARYQTFDRSPNGFLFLLASGQYDRSPVNISLGREILQKLANERLVVNRVRGVFNPNASRGGVPITASFLEDMAHAVARVSNTNVLPMGAAAPEGGFTSASTSVELTSMSFIDDIYGGQRRGDTNGIIGPTGGGKSSLALHMAVQLAKRSWELHLAGEPLEPVIFVTAEEALDRLYPRVWSNAFSILRASLEASMDVRTLSNQQNLRPYEIAMQEGRASVMSEQDRYEDGRRWLNESFKFIDISGTGNYPEAGQGGVDEIASYVDRMCDATGVRPRAVFIDYAGLVIERHLGGEVNKPDRMRMEIKRMGDVLKTRVAGRFNTTVWLLHQLKDAFGSESPVKKPVHSDASDSRGFAVNMAVCGALGVTDRRTNCRWLNWSKVRYAQASENSARIMQIEPFFSRLVDVTGEYAPDIPSKGFLSASEASSFGGVSAIQPNAQPRRAIGNSEATL